MGIEVISVGTELLLGSTVNTNFSYIGQVLAAAGLAVNHERALPDDLAAIRTGVQQALKAQDVVITIGGLGPTQDDLTRRAVADALGAELEHNEAIAEGIRAFMQRRKRPVNEAVIAPQAEMIAGAEVISNDVGTAPGLWCEHEGKVVVLLPGPPRELKPMFRNHVLPRILDHMPPDVQLHTIPVHGLPESVVERRTRTILENFPGVEAGYCVGFGKTDVHLRVEIANATILTKATERVTAEFGDRVITHEHGIVGAICDRLRDRGWMMATAESCTGGGIGQHITQYAGVSDVLAGGIISYSNALKEQLLGVDPETIVQHGAVSEPTARAMVQGLTDRLGVQAGVSVTGIAGPGGGSADKPVGLVYIGSIVNGDIRVREHHMSGDRATVRERTVASALEQLYCHFLEA